jgi:hypothetical protein
MHALAGAAMRGPAIVALGLFALPADLYAAQSQLSGNTIRAKYIFTRSWCTKTGGCQVANNRRPYNVLIYVSTQGRIFDYSSGNSGIVSQLGQSSQMPGGALATWTMQGNALTSHITSTGNLGKLDSYFTYKVVGDRCTVTGKTVQPGFTFRTDIEVQSCEILQGHVER